MRAPQAFLVGILNIGFLVAPLAGEAQSTLEQFRFDASRLCFRDTFRWGFSDRELPGGRAAVKELEPSGRWQGPGEQSIRSVLTPTREDLQRHAADEGRFETAGSHALAAAAHRKRSADEYN